MTRPVTVSPLGVKVFTERSKFKYLQGKKAILHLIIKVAPSPQTPPCNIIQRVYNTISTNKYSVHKREEAWLGWTWVFAKITVVVTVDIGGRYAIDYRVQDRTGVLTELTVFVEMR